MYISIQGVKEGYKICNGRFKTSVWSMVSDINIEQINNILKLIFNNNNNVYYCDLKNLITILTDLINVLEIDYSNILPQVYNNNDINNAKKEFVNNFIIGDYTIYMKTNNIIDLIKTHGIFNNRLYRKTLDGYQCLNKVDYDISDIPIYKYLKFEPSIEPNNDINTINDFVGFKAKYVKKYDTNIIEPIKNHIINIWGSGDFFFNYLANIVQCKDKINKVPVLISEPGCGKNIIAEFLIEYVIGKKYSTLQTTLNIKNNTVLTFIDEVEKKNFNNKQWNTLDSHIGSNINNYNNCIIFSNDANPVRVKYKDRRYLHFKLNNTEIGNTEYFNNIKQCKNQDSGNAFYSFLMDYKINDNLLATFNTEFNAQVICGQMPSHIKFIEENQNKIYASCEHGVISLIELYNLYNDFCKSKKIGYLSRTEFGNIMITIYGQYFYDTYKTLRKRCIRIYMPNQ